ncbi:MAG: ribonuclease P protein component [Candidatus Portnoybacteria bacterium RBG_13_40_8]|uniref:Ribonuclease P protein component n=1 Tax=Candidatus Portnoybacteria bacterium RBG_13_40_8 TaxID=1801990 RepID=A0A1G2F3B7_9BACT|nr:MAG: ribonuclease P protein component [Candidatus Portnoybacteria bacterium RBG_13_40_8]OGZ34827.1 MAG: ribonuclease P protein component [Candidatus Portnoybacteria bacterium RIFCSPHIGHO2_01_FULL_39_19]
MKARQNRLKGADFDNLFKKGKTTSGDFILLKFKRNNLKINRFGFIVGLKTSKKATERNKRRRQLKEIAKSNLINLKPGFDIIIFLKPATVKEKYQKTKEEVEKLFRKSGLYK